MATTPNTPQEGQLSIYKIGARLPIAGESLEWATLSNETSWVFRGMTDARYLRAGRQVVYTDPSKKKRRKFAKLEVRYHELMEEFALLEPGSTDDCHPPYLGLRREVTYSESYEEWEARCTALDSE